MGTTAYLETLFIDPILFYSSKNMFAKQYFVYILCNKYKTTLYNGHTNDISSRLLEHQSKFHGSRAFTSKYNCTYLLFYEIFAERSTAFQRERQIKRFCREKKEALINAQNPEWTFRNQEVYELFPINPDRKNT